MHTCRMHLKGIFLLPNFVICTRRSSGLGSVRFCVCKEPLVTRSPLRQPNLTTFTFLPFVFPQEPSSSLNKVFMTFRGPIKIFSGGRFPKCHNNNKVPCQILVKETIHWKRMNIKPSGMEQQCPLQLYSAVFLFAAICQNTALGSHNIFCERNIFNILGDDQWDKKSKIDWASVFTQAKWCFLYLSISSWTSYIWIRIDIDNSDFIDDIYSMD